MKVEGFIAGRLRFKGRMAVVAIAISFFVIIVAVSISSGFSRQIRKGVSAFTGDILVSNSISGLYGTDDPMPESPGFLAEILAVPGVSGAEPVVYRAGIVKGGDAIRGVMFKGVRGEDASMSVRIPESLASEFGMRAGDDMIAYFISDKIKLRRFKVAGVYEDLVNSGENLMIYAPIADLQRLNEWSGDEVSAIELSLDRRGMNRKETRKTAERIAAISGLAVQSAHELYPQLFDWLDLIDFNVYAILLLMTVVAGFNMISGLLILLFRNISTIGTLKSIGMTDRSIASVFLRVSARIAGMGMLAGNAAALLFCAVQGHTKMLRLNPENYFVSFVPVDVDLLQILAADAVAFIAIMLLLLVPSLFISRIDPSLTVKTE